MQVSCLQNSTKHIAVTKGVGGCVVSSLVMHAVISTRCF